jgi:hypothetical protein
LIDVKHKLVVFYIINRDSSIGIATDYTLDSQGSIPERGMKSFSSPASRPAPGPPYPNDNGGGGSFPVGKAAGREADHSPPSSAEVKNNGVIPPLLYTSSWCGA